MATSMTFLPVEADLGGVCNTNDVIVCFSG
jgi:hypothetical protein